MLYLDRHAWTGWSFRRVRRGFTLVELLVVIAVIAILAALLLPALNRAKLAADSAVCRSNLRQQEIGLAVYASDFGAYPPYYSGPAPSPQLEYWMERLSSYVGGDKWPARNYPPIGEAIGYRASARKSVFACPGYDRLRGFYQGNEIRESLVFGAYGYNGGAPPIFISSLVFVFDGGLGGVELGSDPNHPRGTFDSARESQVVNPSQLIAIGDSQMWQSAEGAVPSVIGGYSSAPMFNSVGCSLVDRQLGTGGPLSPLLRAEEGMVRRHGNRWQMVFCDGHVESGRVVKFFNYHSDDVLRLWNRDNQARR